MTSICLTRNKALFAFSSCRNLLAGYRCVVERSNRLSKFQKVALAALMSVVLLIFMGAIVRTTGSGMGCPDWPKCWGKYIPPTDVSQIDVDALPIEKYKEKRQRMGGNPDDITKETVLAEFHPFHTWMEFTNRLCTTPVAIFSVVTMILSFQFRSYHPKLFYGAFLAVFLVGLNAWMGARIVHSGLQPGTITVHMILAKLLMCVYVYLIWVGRPSSQPLTITFRKRSGYVQRIGLMLFIFIIAEGIMGSQVREVTDELQKEFNHAPRSEWTDRLENTWMYLVHRSFSWAILVAAIWFYLANKAYRVDGVKWQEKLILSMVLCQMVLGLILSQVGVLRTVQVLHVGLSSFLICAMFSWMLAAFHKNK